MIGDQIAAVVVNISKNYKLTTIGEFAQIKKAQEFLY
jgi:hypothetical protein